MKGADIRVGGVYLAKVSGAVQRVRVDRVTDRSVFDRNAPAGVSTRTAWACTNLETGRRIVVKSAQRFRGPAPETREARDAREEREREEAAFRRLDENDCGGAFDGNSVTSDADPGL